MADVNDPEVIDSLLRDTTVWAVVGASPDPSRASNEIAGALRSMGKTVLPITPMADEVLGMATHPDLASVPADVVIDVVDIFRRSDQAGAHVDEAIARGVRAVWMQLGVIDDAAAQRAEAAGLDVVVDRCPKIELARRGW